MKQILLMLAGLKKKVSISVYLVFGGIGLFFIGLIFLGVYSQWFSNPERALFERFFDHAWILIVSLLVVFTGTILGFLDWRLTRIHKKWQIDTPQVAQSEAPAAGGKIAFWVGVLFIVGCAIAAFALFTLVIFFALESQH